MLLVVQSLGACLVRWAIGGLLLILLAVFAVKAAATAKYSYRYRLQISMEVDGKVLTGSV